MMRRSIKSLSFYTLLTLTLGCLIQSSCKDDPEPEPPIEYNHKLIFNSNVGGETAKVYENGLKKTFVLNAEGQGETTITNLEQNYLLDSVTVSKTGFNTWSEHYPNVTTSKTFNATLAELAEFYFHGNTNTKEIKGWKDGNAIMSWNRTNNSESTYQTNSTFQTGNEIVLDSIVGTGPHLIKFKQENVSLSAGSTSLNIISDIAGPFINGNIKDIETAIDLNQAYVFAWDGEGDFIYTQTDTEGNFTLPANFDYNEIKIIKEGFQPRTIYENIEGDLQFDKTVFNLSTFPIEAVVDMTGGQPNDPQYPGKIMHYDTPEDALDVYILEDFTNYQPSAYVNVFEQGIVDVNDMYLGNTTGPNTVLNIAYIQDENELPEFNDENPFIYIKFVSGQNSGYGIFQTTNQENIRQSIITINYITDIQAYNSFLEELGSGYGGVRDALSITGMYSNYNADAMYNTSELQPVDFSLHKFHFSRKNGTETRTDTGETPNGFNDLTTGGEINFISYFSNGSLTLQTYNELPQIVRDNIEN